MKTAVGFTILALVCACSGGKSGNDMASVSHDMVTGAGGGDMASAMQMHDMAGTVGMIMDMAIMTGGGNIPDPGNAMPGAQPFFNDVNGTPNQSPSTALPVGQVNGATIMAWVSGNPIAANQTDYFVFKANSGGTFQLGSTGVCSTPQALAKIDLWNVVNKTEQTPPVQEWTPSAGDPNCITGTTTLVSGNTYLLGFTANGTGGSYNA